MNKLFCWHDYGRWEQIDAGTIVPSKTLYIIDKRICVKCGNIDVRVTYYPHKWPPAMGFQMST